jgi:hypothetical protein
MKGGTTGTARTEQDGVQHVGECTYCQNTSPNQQFCDSGKTASEEIQQETGTSKICNRPSGTEA